MDEQELILVRELRKYISKKMSKEEISSLLAGMINVNYIGDFEDKKLIIDNYLKEVLER